MYWMECKYNCLTSVASSLHQLLWKRRTPVDFSYNHLCSRAILNNLLAFFSFGGALEFFTNLSKSCLCSCRHLRSLKRMHNMKLALVWINTSVMLRSRGATLT